MAKVFGILTAIVLALAGFVAYKNKAAYATEVENVAQEKSKLAEAQKRIKVAQDSFAVVVKKRSDGDEEVVKLAAQEEAQKKTNEDLTQENAAKTAKVEPNKQKIAGFKEKTAKIGDLNALASKLRAAKSELEEIDQSITSSDAKLANLTAQTTEAEAQAKVAKTTFEKFTTGQSLATLNTRIRSVYPAWGFVTLAAGNNAGVVANSTLDVVRDGVTIAKLLVTAVENTTSSASIIPDSIGQNVTLRVGDRVIPTQKDAKTANN
jgi:hypothetical protein